MPTNVRAIGYATEAPMTLAVAIRERILKPGTGNIRAMVVYARRGHIYSTLSRSVVVASLLPHALIGTYNRKATIRQIAEDIKCYQQEVVK